MDAETRDLMARGERASAVSRRLVRESYDIERALLNVRQEDSLVVVAIRRGRIARERREAETRGAPEIGHGG